MTLSFASILSYPESYALIFLLILASNIISYKFKKGGVVTKKGILLSSLKKTGLKYSVMTSGCIIESEILSEGNYNIQGETYRYIVLVTRKNETYITFAGKLHTK